MNGAGRVSRSAVQGGLDGLGHARPQFLQSHGRFVQDVLGQRVRVVHVGLVYGLAVPFAHNRCRSIRRDAEERDACVECLCKRRSVVDCSRARSANDRNRRPSRQRHAKGMMGRSPFVDAYANLNVRVAMEGKHERRVTRPWTHHRVLHAMLGKDGCNRRRCRMRTAQGHVAKVRGAQPRKAGAKLWSFASVSSHSSSGTEPSTMPPPANNTTPLLAQCAHRKFT